MKYQYPESVLQVLERWTANEYDENDKPQLAITNADVSALLAEINRLAMENQKLWAVIDGKASAQI